ncbi:MAG TPA: FkbM family methyltransferase [Longimicrobiaceae bacterium]|nr:FkbM family methyltransferase [Longimicrobiaceae bacterium]
MRLPIWGGVLRGRWWLPASRGKILRILGGTYEPEQTALFRRHVQPGARVLDVGAHVGYYTLVSSVLAGPTGKVWAFEPNPTNHAFLRRHVQINGRGNVTVVQAAVSDRPGTARFDFGTGSGTGHLAEDGAIEVRTLRLDDFCAEQGADPTAVKIDVEGAEMQVLEGAEQVIARARPVIFLSTHGAEVHARCLAWLRERGYGLTPILGGDVATTSEVLCLPADRAAA